MILGAAYHHSAIGDDDTFVADQICLGFTLARNSKTNQTTKFLDKHLRVNDPPGKIMKPKKTILCVDDNEQSLSIRKVLLETRGYRVISCNNGQLAFEMFRQGGIDLVITDLIMPGLDGSKLIEQIKSISPQTPTVLISGRVKIYEQETVADIFLPKGMYEPAELLERIRLLLVRKRGPKLPFNFASRTPQQPAVA